MTDSNADQFTQIAYLLQQRLGAIDLARAPAPRSPYLIEHLLVRSAKIRLRMYQEPAHNLPHLHVDYGRNRHVAGYSLDPPRLISGSLDKYYERCVIEWIDENRAVLTKIWEHLQEGAEVSEIVAELGGLD